MAFAVRNGLIDSLFRAYLRVPDKALARKSFGLIDQLFPIRDEHGSYCPNRMRFPFDAEVLRNDPISIFSRGLALVDTREEWRQVLDGYRAGGGALPFLQDRDLLIRPLDHPAFAVRWQALNQLAAMNDPASWNAVAAALDDPQLRDRAGGRILSARYFALFNAVDEANRKAPLSIDDFYDHGMAGPGDFENLFKALRLEEIEAKRREQLP